MRNFKPGLYLVFFTLCLLLFGSSGCSQGESKQVRNIAGERDDLIGWYRMANNTLIPVFKYSGTYYSVSRGFEFPLQPCPEGLVMGMEPSNTNGTTIGRLGQSDRYFISIYDEQRANIEEGFISGQKQEIVKVKKPSGLLDKKTKAPAPRTNDDFLGWYMPVWFPWFKIEISKDGSDYFSTDHGMRHSGQWVAGKPTKLTLRTEGLGFTIGGEPANLIYNTELKRYEITLGTSVLVRMPLARILANEETPSELPRIGIPFWH